MYWVLRQFWVEADCLQFNYRLEGEMTGVEAISEEAPGETVPGEFWWRRVV